LPRQSPQLGPPATRGRSSVARSARPARPRSSGTAAWQSWSAPP